MKGLFLEDNNKDFIQYKDLSNELILGVNRCHDDENGVRSIVLQPNEAEDLAKKQVALSMINENTWITSDLHLNHKNRNSADFVNQMVNEINSKVKLTDCILFLGDMGKKDDPNQKDFIKKFLERLNCKNVILVLGNHDILHLSDWYDAGFIFVTDKIVHNVNGKTISFTHFPDYIDDVYLNYHGHIHDEKEYWNLPWIKHVNCYCGIHENKIYQFKDYLKFYSEGKYKGVTKKVKPKKPYSK